MVPQMGSSSLCAFQFQSLYVDMLLALWQTLSRLRSMCVQEFMSLSRQLSWHGLELKPRSSHVEVISTSLTLVHVHTFKAGAIFVECLFPQEIVQHLFVSFLVEGPLNVCYG